MKRVLLLIPVVLLISALGIAQTSQQPTDPTCGTHEKLVYGIYNCVDRAHFAFFAAGGSLVPGRGWKSVITFTNTTSARVMFSFTLVPPDGVATSGFGSIIRIYGHIDSHYNNVFALGAFGELDPGQFGQIEILYPVVCTGISTCGPRPDLTQTGSVMVTIQAPDGQTLDTQDVKATNLLFTFSDADTGVTIEQVSAGLSMDNQGSPKWEAVFTETPSSSKATSPNNNTVSFAGLNGQTKQSLQIEVNDCDGNLLASMQTPELGPNAVFSSGLLDFFGAALPPMPLQQDGLSHACLIMSGNKGGGIIPFLPLTIGQSLSVLPMWKAK